MPGTSKGVASFVRFWRSSIPDRNCSAAAGDEHSKTNTARTRPRPLSTQAREYPRVNPHELSKARSDPLSDEKLARNESRLNDPDGNSDAITYGAGATFTTSS